MKSQRQLQIGENIKRVMSEIFLKEDYSVINNNVITIIKADVSPDAKNVKIYIDIFGDKTKHQEIFQMLNSRINHFRYQLAQKIDFRTVPEIVFINDNSSIYIQSIENIIINETIKNSEKKNIKNNLPKNKKIK
jgi:ribosome-binding factor A